MLHKFAILKSIPPNEGKLDLLFQISLFLFIHLSLIKSFPFFIEKMKLSSFPSTTLPFSKDYHEIVVKPPKTVPFS
jgi:hypothetical protein